MLSALVHVWVPIHIEFKTSSEIYVHINNRGDRPVEGFEFDLSMVRKYFDIEEFAPPEHIDPGIEIKEWLTINSRFDAGTYPIRIRISGNGLTIEKEYTIKVGGTEIY